MIYSLQQKQVNLDRSIALWHERLMDISWFKRIINDYIARMANQEDDCTERFWEDLFSSQVLLDEKTLAACSAYVDLNPLRAEITDNLTGSDHTSIKRRCEQATKANQPNDPQQQTDGLTGNPRSDTPHGLPFRLSDYLDLVDWTGRILRDDKRGEIQESKPKILKQLNIDPKHWCYLSQNFESEFKSLVGTSYHIKQACVMV